MARARQTREDARRLLAEGPDPAVEKKRQAQVRTDALAFRGIAEEYVAKRRREGRSEATLAKTEWLLSFANAAFGYEPLREIVAPAKGDVLFSSVRSLSRPMSDGTLNAALRRLGYAKDEATSHGFRATA